MRIPGFVQLTLAADEMLLIPTSRIMEIEAFAGGSLVYIEGRPAARGVKETPKEIADLLAEQETPALTLPTTVLLANQALRAHEATRQHFSKCHMCSTPERCDVWIDLHNRANDLTLTALGEER